MGYFQYTDFDRLLFEQRQMGSVSEAQDKETKKTKQYKGLMRTTGHTVPDDYSSELQKDPPPKRGKPKPKKGWDIFPDRVKAQKGREDDSAKHLGKKVATTYAGSHRSAKTTTAKTIRALRALRDKPTKLKKKRAEMAGRRKMKLPESRVRQALFSLQEKRTKEQQYAGQRAMAKKAKAEYDKHPGKSRYGGGYQMGRAQDAGWKGKKHGQDPKKASQSASDRETVRVRDRTVKAYHDYEKKPSALSTGRGTKHFKAFRPLTPAERRDVGAERRDQAQYRRDLMAKEKFLAGKGRR